jgi:hypothetical protein
MGHVTILWPFDQIKGQDFKKNPPTIFSLLPGDPDPDEMSI